MPPNKSTLVLKLINEIVGNQSINDAFERINNDYLKLPVRYMIEKIDDLNTLKFCIFRGFQDFKKGLYWSVFYQKDFLVDYFINNLKVDMYYAIMGAYRLFDLGLAKSYIEKYNDFIIKKLNITVLDDMLDLYYHEFNQRHESVVIRELCSSGNVEKFDEFTMNDHFNIGVLWLSKVGICRKQSGAAIESESIEMIEYVINNASLDTSNQFEKGEFYKNIIRVLIEKSEYPTNQLFEILKFLFYHKDLNSINFKYSLVLLFIKIGKFKLIKDDIYENIESYRNVDLNIGLGSWHKILWFANDEEFYNKVRINKNLSYNEFRFIYKSFYDMTMIENDGINY